MPELENGEIKNFFGIPARGGVIREQFLDRTLVKVAACHGLGIEKKVMNPVLKLATKPCFVRNGEASLFALQNFARHATAQCFLGDIFCGETMDFEILRQGSSEFEDFVIEQRDTEFDGIGHGHFVSFDEEIVWQPSFCVHVEHFAEWPGTVAVAKMFSSGVQRESLVNAAREI